jgi:hypothetical protein
MNRNELELQLENLEGMFDEIATLLDDPEVSDAELRERVREILEGDDASE